MTIAGLEFTRVCSSSDLIPGPTESRTFASNGWPLTRLDVCTNIAGSAGTYSEALWHAYASKVTRATCTEAAPTATNRLHPLVDIVMVST